MELARNLGIQTMTLPISDIMKTYDGVLADAFRGLPPDVTEENIQSRIRGNLLMALSNKFGSLLLTTGNKSRDVGGLLHAVRRHERRPGGDRRPAEDDGVPRVALAQSARPDIPEAILTKAPSAELRPDQTDQDSLPPYELLDQILELHVEQCRSRRKRSSRKAIDEQTVRRVLRLVRIAEFKRKQAAPVLKVTSRAFGTGWRMPIVRQE